MKENTETAVSFLADTNTLFYILYWVKLTIKFGLIKYHINFGINNIRTCGNFRNFQTLISLFALSAWCVFIVRDLVYVQTIGQLSLTIYFIFVCFILHHQSIDILPFLTILTLLRLGSDNSVWVLIWPNVSTHCIQYSVDSDIKIIHLSTLLAGKVILLFNFGKINEFHFQYWLN